MESNYLVFWPLYLLSFFALTILAIPSREYKKYLIYGIVFGGIISTLSIIIIGNLFGVFTYHAGSLTALGIPAPVPLAFIFTWMLFFYFLPSRRLFVILYTVFWVGLSVMLGVLLQNFGYFTYDVGTVSGVIIQTLVFGAWFFFSVWYFMRDRERNSNNV
ncbi:MAG: hypothetical protein ACOYJD_05305 [Christensenellales bacterium]